jgi:hypothetical protein
MIGAANALKILFACVGQQRLIDPALKEFLIGAKSRRFVGAGRRKARRQRDRGGQAADRRKDADIPLSGPYPAGAADIRRADQPRKIEERDLEVETEGVVVGYPDTIDAVVQHSRPRRRGSARSST